MKYLGSGDATQSYLGGPIVNSAIHWKVLEKTTDKNVLRVNSDLFTTIFSSVANQKKAEKVEPFKSNPSYFEHNTIVLLPFVKSRP